MANVIKSIAQLTKIIDLLDIDWNINIDKNDFEIKLKKWKKKYENDYYVKKATYLNIVFDVLNKSDISEEELHLVRQITFYYQFKVPFYVYKHICPNGKIYIGITCQNPPYLRWMEGNGYESNEKFFNDIKQYGWNNFTHEILYDNLDEYEATVIERKLIKEYKSDKQEYGYNLDKGGRKPAKPKLWQYDRYHQWHQSRKIYKLIVEEKELQQLLNSDIYTMDVFYCNKIENIYGFNIYLVKGYAHSTRESTLNSE